MQTSKINKKKRKRISPEKYEFYIFLGEIKMSILPSHDFEFV